MKLPYLIVVEPQMKEKEMNRKQEYSELNRNELS